ncbi:MAG: DUF3416 domain-containing protein [Candidatus Ancillula sp.]|jgi:starch synthase (maltosyl-transferring)|nr:DUF3416 domain-containing protein [Candidatus Ancillula sp.]
MEQINRIPVINVGPVDEGGRFPAKVIQNEVFPIWGKVFREGHDLCGATGVLYFRNSHNQSSSDSLSGLAAVAQLAKVEKLKAKNSKVKQIADEGLRFPMWRTGFDGDDDWTGLIQVDDRVGSWEFGIESWSDVFGTWQKNARIKIANNQDINLVFAEGEVVFNKWLETDDPVSKLTDAQKQNVHDSLAILLDKSLTPDVRFERALSGDIWNIYNSNPLRELVSQSTLYPLQVQRKLSSFSAWYQFFPRSEGAELLPDGKVKTGTFKTAKKSLQRVKDMGFDIIYLPPIHPIGIDFRKGRNNSLEAGENDPGSPWAVQDHTKINPDLGTEEDLIDFINEAHRLGLEVSLDLALQCSPDHPWVKEHPEWFNVRPDGSIAYAENPPKKYQDIYPINFDKDPDGIFNEVLKICKQWIKWGVSSFRVDNPHTKPAQFWQRLIEAVKSTNPETVWLAEAFTLPAMMRTLGLVGFDQSHSYFLWRNTKQELSEFLPQISGDDGFYFRSTLWPTTPDNLTDFLASGGQTAHAIRAILAALGSPTWGIYSGYELVEDEQRRNPDGTKALEHQDSEKYEIKVRNWDEAQKKGIAVLLGKLNYIRNQHFACQNLHSLQIHDTDNDNIIAFSRHIDALFTKDNKDDTIIVVVSLDPQNGQRGYVHLDWGRLHLPEVYHVVDELTDKEYDLAHDFYADLSPVTNIAHVFKVVRD